MIGKSQSLITSGTALFAGIIAAVAVLTTVSGSPFSAAVQFFSGPFSSRFSVGTWLNTCSLLCFAAAGAALALQSGNFNLGGEGQVYLSGFVTAVVLNALSDSPGFFALSVALGAALFSTALLGLFSGVLKVFGNISELLTSFLLSGALIPLVDYGIVGRFRDQSKNLLATPRISEKFQISSLLPPSSLNWSFFLGITLCLLAFLVLYHSRIGYRYRMCGKAPEFAAFSGFNPGFSGLAGMCLSGLFHGLTGFFAVTGTYYTCYSGFYSGMGWNALTVALIARSNPLALVPASLALSFLLTASDQAVLMYNLPFDVSTLIVASVLMCITAQFFLDKRQKKVNRPGKNDRAKQGESHAR